MKAPKNVNEPYRTMNLPELRENHAYWTFKKNTAPGQPSESQAAKFLAQIEKEMAKRLHS